MRKAHAFVFKFLDEINDLFLAANQSPNPTNPLWVFFSCNYIHLNGSDAALCPPVEAIDDLHEWLLAMFDSSGMHLFEFYELELTIIMRSVLFVGNVLEQINDLAGANIESEAKLHVGWHLHGQL